MENGVGIADGSRLGEKVMENEVLESRVEERDAVGSDETKDSEGDEVFEEAVAGETPRGFPVDIGVNGSGKVDEVGNLDVSVEAVEISDVGNEVEKFEEAIGVPVVVGDHGEELLICVEDKVDGLVGAEHVYESKPGEFIDEESVTDKPVRDEMNAMETDVLVTTGDEEVREVSDISSAGEKGTLNDGVSDIVNLEGTLVLETSDKEHANKAGMQVDEKSETVDSGFVQEGDTNSQQEVEFIGNTPAPAEKSNREEETMGLLDTGHQDDKSCRNEGHVVSELHADSAEELEDNLVNLDTELKDDKHREPKEAASARPVPYHHNDKSEELKDTTGLENQDETSPELNYKSATVDSGHHGMSSKPEDNLHLSVEEVKVTPGVEKLPTLEDSTVEDDEKIKARASDLGTRNIKGTQLQHADEDVEAPYAVAKEPENKGAKDEEVKQSTQVNGQGEIKPAADASASSGKSSNPTLTPARPAGLGRDAPLLEPAPRAAQHPRVNGTLPQMQNQLI